MALKNVAPLLSKEFVSVKLDYDRQPDAKEIERRYIDKDQGLPWMAFLDGDGKLLIHSTPAKGNIGHPYQPDEVDYFRQMLQKVKHHLTDADIDALIASLVAANKAGG